MLFDGLGSTQQPFITSLLDMMDASKKGELEKVTELRKHLEEDPLHKKYINIIDS